MKPCKPKYEHIDQNEFGDGRKITTNLLKRFCSNISGLWKKTGELEDNTDPELRKRFTPPILHDLHSYGITLNNNNEYEFDNSVETVFLDAIGLKTITITNLTKIEKNNKILYTKKLKTTQNIATIALDVQNNKYPSKESIDTLTDSTFGYHIDQTTNQVYILPSTNEKCDKIFVQVYSDDPYIDRKNTTAHVNLTNNTIHAPYSKQQFKGEVLDQNTAVQYTIGPNNEEISTIRGIEKYWNFGWRKFNHFWMYPLWLQDPFAESPNTPPIPTVARAFIITPRNTGLLTRIRLMFYVKNGAEDDVYCEIRETNTDGSPSAKILTREKTRIRGTAQAMLHTIEFTLPPFLEKSKKYAVVVRAGFTSSEKSYGLGGWSSFTYGAEFLGNILHKASAKLEGTPSDDWKRIYDFDEDILSTIYTSTDNCDSWVKSGNSILDRMRPRAFSYQTFIQPLKTEKTFENGKFVVYWKPIKTNPIQSIQLIPTSQNGNVRWEVSVNMKDWHSLTHPQWDYNFSNEGSSYERDQNSLYIRAILESDENNKPVINGLKAIIKTKPATTAYLKTLFYNPRLGNLLGSSLWSKLGTNVTLTPPITDDVDVKIDVIRNMVMKDMVKCDGHTLSFPLSEKPSKPLVNVTIHPDTLYLTGDEQIIDHDSTTAPSTTITPENKQKFEELQKILTKIDELYEIIKKSDDTEHQSSMKVLADHFFNVDGIINKLQCEKDALKLLKESVTPLKSLDGCDKSECLLNYIVMLRNIIINTINLLKNPTSKFIEVVPQVPGRDDGTLELTENRDYTIDYEQGILTLVDAWGFGTLKIEYYPLWIQSLRLKDFPFRTDFLTEIFPNTNTLKLRTVPLDPLRTVEQYKKEKNEWIELAEDIDYKVDYIQKTVHIIKDSENMEYRVKYTPYLVDEGLALAYRMERKDNSHQAAVKSCYFQNRV